MSYDRTHETTDYYFIYTSLGTQLRLDFSYKIHPTQLKILKLKAKHNPVVLSSSPIKFEADCSRGS